MKPPVHVLRSLLAALLVSSPILIVLCIWPDHLPLARAEQHAIAAGDPEWHVGELCQKAAANSGCNFPDTSCSEGDGFCAEEQMTGEYCRDAKDYEGETVFRCKQDDTKYCCNDSIVAGNGTERCYRYWNCVCGFYIQQSGKKLWFCAWDQNPVQDIDTFKCKHKPPNQCP